MYQTKVLHPLSALVPTVTDSVAASMWNLFVAIGPYWELTDDPEPYRLRFTTFMQNRIALNPIYAAFYAAAATCIDVLIAHLGEPAAYAVIFSKQNDDVASVPLTTLNLVQQYVSSEFIAIRVALGGFKDFGAINYCGYFGGANILDEPVPYRTLKDAQ
ncbi:MAG: hypothetical protein QOI24_4655 [Acidobacteriota bacterium]|jgi:hypothetical protein|nr:hypothetical protein [Acidobacteriota bacterium]